MGSKLLEMETNIEETIQKNRYLKRDPTNHVFLFDQAKDLIKLGLEGEQSEDNMNYQLAFEFLRRAIDQVDSKKLFVQKAIYLAARSQLYVKINKTEEAVQDIVTLSDLKKYYTSNPLRNYYIQNTQSDILTLTSIKTTISNLVLNNQLDHQIGTVLLEHANITAGLVVKVGAHSEQLQNHDERLTQLESELVNNNASKELTKKILHLLSSKSETFESDILDLAKTVELSEFKIQELQSLKLDKGEVESFAIKIPEEISSNPGLKQYFDSLYNKLYSAMVEAEAISGGGHLELAGSAKISILTGIIGLIPIPYARPMASAAKEGPTLVIKNKTKKKASNLIRINLDPAIRQNILKQVAIQITLDERQRAIENMKTTCNLEVQAIRNSKSFQDRVKDVFVVNIDDKIYRKIDLHILGYVDAKKIIWALNESLIKSVGNKEEVIKELIKIPNAYSYIGEKTYEKKTDMNSDTLCGF